MRDAYYEVLLPASTDEFFGMLDVGAWQRQMNTYRRFPSPLAMNNPADRGEEASSGVY